MVFNTTDKQFTTDIKIKDQSLETVSEAKLLGVYITNDLKWHKNTEEIVKKANKRMLLLRKASKFTSQISDLTTIYKIFIRSILENSCVVWHSSLTELDSEDIERVQKSACKVILKEYFEDYEKALKILRLENLKERRENLCLSFAKKCLTNTKVKSMFPLYTSKKILRNQNKFSVKFANTERYRKSAVLYMQNLLNEHEKVKKKFVRFKGL